jgi:hypothetical protein
VGVVLVALAKAYAHFCQELAKPLFAGIVPDMKPRSEIRAM